MILQEQYQNGNVRQKTNLSRLCNNFFQIVEKWRKAPNDFYQVKYWGEIITRL